MDKWDKAAADAWEAILKKVKELHDSGQTLESIAKLLGIKNKGTISLWKSGERKAENTSFSTMLRYLEKLGLNYCDFIPQSANSSSDNCDVLKKEIVHLKSENSDLKEKLLVAETRASSYQEVLKMLSSSNSTEKVGKIA